MEAQREEDKAERAGDNKAEARGVKRRGPRRQPTKKEKEKEGTRREKEKQKGRGERERGMFPELLLRSWWPGAGPRREVHRKNIPGCMPLCFSIWFLIVARPWFGMGRLAFVSAWKSRFWKFSR